MKAQSAFTLLELMTTVAVIAILASIAIPSMRSTLINNRITSKTNEFVRAINYLRSEAIIHNNNIAHHIQALDIDDINISNEFGEGWRVWVDLNNDGDYEEDIGIDVVKEFRFPNDNIVINDANNSSRIEYGNRGRPVMAYRFNICNNEHPRGRIVRISASGRVSVESCSLKNGGSDWCGFSC